MRSALSAMTLLLALQASGSLGAADTDQLRKTLQARMPDMHIGAITRTAHAGLYEVVVNGFTIVYTDDKGEIAVLGKIVDLRSNTDLTQRRTQELQTIDFSRLP